MCTGEMWVQLPHTSPKNFFKKISKKVLTNHSKCGIMIIEIKERGKYYETVKCNNQL